MFVIDTASLYGYNKQTTDLLKLRARSFRWKVMAESTVRWFVVREKHCSSWKNKLKNTNYKTNEHGLNTLVRRNIQAGPRLQAYYYVQLPSLLWRVSWGRAKSVWVARGAAMWHWRCLADGNRQLWWRRHSAAIGSEEAPRRCGRGVSMHRRCHEQQCKQHRRRSSLQTSRSPSSLHLD
jgi:hypothetical protein